jgi:hypothetical protein
VFKVLLLATYETSQNVSFRSTKNAISVSILKRIPLEFKQKVVEK